MSALAATAASAWSSQFAARRAGFETVIIPLSDAFVRYLCSGGCSLPHPPAGTKLKRDDPRSREFVTDLEKDSAVETFPEEEELVTRAIAALGGSVFSKLDWTAPTDATWITVDNSARCSTPGQVFALLKASELVQYDVAAWRSQSVCSGYRGLSPLLPRLHLILRPWFNLHHDREFRCFVREKVLVAVCQRHPGLHFPYDSLETARIQSTVESFAVAEVIPAFDLLQYSADVYVDRRHKVWLVDVNAVNKDADPLLFEWAEIGMSVSDDCSTPDTASESVARVKPVLAAGATLETSATPPVPPVLWRCRRLPEAGASGASGGARAAEESLPGAVGFVPHASHRFPADLCGLCGETGKSVAALLDDFAEAVARHGPGGGGLFQTGCSSDEEGEESDEA